jgi:[NiFe] hydrogenase assembly HybE family chaperone
VNAVESRPADELALEALFQGVHATRMRDLPLNNPQLRVEALGFRDWQGARVGALVTPWSVLLTILPGPGGADGGGVRRLSVGCTQVWRFPSGEYEFHGHEAEGLGHYQQCSLFSPALEFESHEAARIAALAALDALLAVPPPPEPRKVSRRGLLLGG